MRVYIGIPFYGGAGAQFVSSLLKTRVVFDRLGWDVEVDFHNGCSILTKARNEIVKRFMDSGFDVLLFLDSDMEWNPVDAVRLIQMDKPFAAGIYRVKSEEIRYNCTPAGPGKADAVGTGFIAVKREVFEKMIEAYPQTKYTERGEEFHALFDFEVFEGRYWGEDYTFCRRWRAIGGEIDILPDVELKHIGTKAYTGTYS